MTKIAVCIGALLLSCALSLPTLGKDKSNSGGNDQQIQNSMQKWLNDKGSKYSGVQASVEDGVLTLTGQVPLLIDKLDADRKAHSFARTEFKNAIPAEVPTSIRREQMIQEAFQNGTCGTLGVRLAQLGEQERREAEPISYVSRLPRVSD